MSGGIFPVTRPSAISDLLSGDPGRQERSLAVLAEVYWRPLYKYVRLRWGKSGEDAEDLTQGFFAGALGREVLSQFDPARARFRTFLRRCVDRFVIDDHRRTTAQRRGGKDRLTVDFAAAEREVAGAAPSTDPEAAFEAEWLSHLVAVATARLLETLARKGKPHHAELFRRFHLGGDPPAYADVAAELGITVTDVTNWLSYARREFRRTALELLREVTVSEDEFAEEARAAFGLDVRAGAPG
ncbi:MAG: sigma-70 family RNA polymerase sigma factor [Kofleriaceae bacterium]|nr:sigma-70 family RNA polymerase sigma factor [Kofleriaceae bacterium]MBP9204257.1 sigma-70 family RNA polymerase sigma factor [Kofleriaceae bacterium]